MKARMLPVLKLLLRALSTVLLIGALLSSCGDRHIDYSKRPSGHSEDNNVNDKQPLTSRALYITADEAELNSSLLSFSTSDGSSTVSLYFSKEHKIISAATGKTVGDWSCERDIGDNGRFLDCLDINFSASMTVDDGKDHYELKGRIYAYDEAKIFVRFEDQELALVDNGRTWRIFLDVKSSRGSVAAITDRYISNHQNNRDKFIKYHTRKLVRNIDPVVDMNVYLPQFNDQDEELVYVEEFGNLSASDVTVRDNQLSYNFALTYINKKTSSR